MNKIDRIRGGLVWSNALGMFNLNRGSQSCKKTPACEDCYVGRSTQVFRYTRLAWSPGGRDDQNWAKIQPNVFTGLARVRIASRGEGLRTKADVARVVTWVKANPDTLFWIPTRAIYKNRGKDLDVDHMNLITNTLASLPNARVIASLDPFTAKHWVTLRDANWSTMFYESSNVPKDYQHSGSHPARGKKGANIHFCAKTWDLYLAENGRVVSPKGNCKSCGQGCFDEKRVDVWLRNHSKAAPLTALTDKARAQKSLES